MNNPTDGIAVTEPNKERYGRPFFLRYWYLILTTLAGLWAAVNEWAFQQVGTIGYVVAIFFLCVTIGLFARHTIFRTTLKKYVDRNGKFAEDFWDHLTPFQRQIITVIYTIGLIWGAAFVAIAVSK